MLKSHFNLAQGDEEETRDEETRDDVTRDEEGEDEQGEVIVDEEKLVVFKQERRLDKAEVSVRLSMLGKTAEGDGFTYLKAKCTDMNLTNINAIKCFKYLQFVDVSNNQLNLDSLQAVTKLPSLVLIHADKNLCKSAALKKMKYLQVIIMNYNQITSVHDVYQPELSTLEVGYNSIQKVHFDVAMPSLRCLDFRYNNILDVQDFNFPNLDSLYLAGNKITSLIGLENLVNLRILHVRNNPIKHLYGFDPRQRKLQYINLRNCKVGTLKQVKRLRVLTALDTLMMKGCPYMGGTGEETPETAAEEEDPETRLEVLASLPRLKRINKNVVSPEERTEAKELMMQWLEDGEKDEEEIEDEQNANEESNVED